MQIAAVALEDRFVRLEPFEEGLEAEVKTALDCDPEAWGVMVAPAYGDHFDDCINNCNTILVCE